MNRQMLSMLDYKCLITNKDTSQTGGYAICHHVSDNFKHCNPKTVLSPEGLQFFRSQKEPICPYCNSKLTHSHFMEVPSRPNYDSDDDHDDIIEDD